MRAERARTAILVAALAAGLCAGGCSHLRAVSEPRSGSLHASDSLARAAILRALSGRRFTVESDTPGSIVATLEDASTWLRIAVTYDASGYAIEYRESMGLDETIGDDGERRVDGRYHRWIEALAVDIERVITRPETANWAAVSPTATAGGAAPAAGPTPAAAAPAATSAPPTAYGAPAAVAAPPAPVAAPATPTIGVYGAPGTYVAPPTSGGYAVPTATPAGPAARIHRRTHPLDEALITGLVLLAGTWVANWGVTLGISDESRMIGFSFLPIAGPFVQLGFLQWALYERWTGLWYPVSGVLQIAGLITAIVGATARIPDDDEGSAPLAGFGRSWTLVPTVGAESGGLTLAGTF